MPGSSEAPRRHLPGSLGRFHPPPYRLSFSMRILLTHHAPLGQSPSGWFAWHCAQGLRNAGVEIRLLLADEEHRFGEPIGAERVVCGTDPNADLTFGLPRFSAESPSSGRPTFADLTDGQLTRYRDCLRRRLDSLILHFNPHVIHCQHIWLIGQLALESGVPYVLSAWGPELDDGQGDARLGPLAEQAAENASRVLANDKTVLERVKQQFEAVDERVLMLSAGGQLEDAGGDAAAESRLAGELVAIYEAVLQQRFG